MTGAFFLMTPTMWSKKDKRTAWYISQNECVLLEARLVVASGGGGDVAVTDRGQGSLCSFLSFFFFNWVLVTLVLDCVKIRVLFFSNMLFSACKLSLRFRSPYFCLCFMLHVDTPKNLISWIRLKWCRNYYLGIKKMSLPEIVGLSGQNF